MKRKSKDQTLTANLSLKIAGEPLNLTLEAPKGPTRPIRMLPVFRAVCGSVVDWTVRRIEREGRSISCKAGCGACCRQMVPISKTEARRLAQIVDEMPDERGHDVRERFAFAVRHFNDANLIEKLSADPKPTRSDYKELGLAYFHEGVACPFLENDSCSIHPERPLVCREYLVVSPAENCSRKNGLPVEAIKMPLEASKALTAIDDGKDENFTNWIPLVLALEWAATNREESAERPGTAIAEKFISELAGTDLTRIASGKTTA